MENAERIRNDIDWIEREFFPTVLLPGELENLVTLTLERDEPQLPFRQLMGFLNSVNSLRELTEQVWKINCTAGKDRTGTTSAVLLWLCGVSFEDIIYDYMITKVTNRERFKRVKERFPDLDINIVIPNENNMREFLNIMTEKYGRAENYFSAIGISEEEQEKIKARMTDRLINGAKS